MSEQNLVKSESNIIFFDGVCGLCNGFVDFVLKQDHKSHFKFSPLQSEYARAHLPKEFIQDLTSVVVQIDGKTLRKSKAVLAVLQKLGGLWAVLSLSSHLPLSLLNTAYDLVAKNRYKLFGKKETCRIPSLEERARFLL